MSNLLILGLNRSKDKNINHNRDLWVYPDFCKIHKGQRAAKCTMSVKQNDI